MKPRIKGPRPATSEPTFCRRTLILGGATQLALCATGCAGSPGDADSSNFADRSKSKNSKYTGPLVSPDDIPGDFLWEQRVTALRGNNQGSFDAVLQKRGSELLVLGLTPMKTRGFSLSQLGQEFEYKQAIPFELPFSPEAVLFDIHRAFFFGLLEDFPKDGTLRSAWRGEAIADDFANGRLLRRTFSNVSGTEENLLITYSGAGYAWGRPPELTTLNNQAFGYLLRVETSSARAI